MESRSGTFTTEFLWFWHSGVSNQQSSVVRSESFFQFVFGLFINVFLMVSNQTFGNSLSDSVNLGDVTTTSDSDSDVNVGKFVQTNQDQWFVDFESQDFWLNQSNWRTVDFDQTFTGFDVGDSGGRFFFTESLL